MLAADGHSKPAIVPAAPGVAAGLDNAELSGRVIGVRDLLTYFRRAAGSGGALVGHAAHHKDPLAARGISDALPEAELLADHVLRGWDNDHGRRCGAPNAGTTRPRRWRRSRSSAMG